MINNFANVIDLNMICKLEHINKNFKYTLIILIFNIRSAYFLFHQLNLSYRAKLRQIKKFNQLISY